MKTVNLDKATFLKKVMDFEKNPSKWEYLGDKPAIIDFYADWCGPCQALSPILDEIAEEYGDDITVYKVNTEVEEELSAMFGIRSIPSLLFVPMDEEPKMAQGLVPKESLKEMIDTHLLKK